LYPKRWFRGGRSHMRRPEKRKRGPFDQKRVVPRKDT